jgi:hypothetical protein
MKPRKLGRSTKFSKPNKKIDTLIESRVIMMLAEKSLNDFLEKEPDIYSARDIKVRYY